MMPYLILPIVIYYAYTMKYINTIKQKRLELNLSQQQLATYLQIPHSQDRISDWELGLRLPKIYTIYKLCALFNVTPYELYPDTLLI